jgi:membrane-associated phospholipid phosphatase
MMNDLMSFFFGTEPIRWIQQLFGLGHPLPFRIFSLLGDTWGMIAITGAALWLFGRERMHAVAAAVAAGAAAKVALSTVFQQQRPRGGGIVVYEHLEVSSFPSGHVFEAVGPWGMLFALGCVSLAVAALVVVLVALGRLYLGTHFVGDVVGGMVFGAVFVWLFFRGWQRVRPWLYRRSPRFFAVAAAVAVGAAVGWTLLIGGSPRRWEVAGIVVGGAAGLLLEHHRVRYAPRPGPRARGAAMVALGVAGIAALLLVDRGFPENALVPGMVTAGLATLWAVAGAPALFARLGWGEATAAGSPSR